MFKALYLANSSGKHVGVDGTPRGNSIPGKNDQVTDVVT